MQKYIFPVLLAFIFNTPASKASVYRDSIGVENFKGKKLIIHKVVAKDTYYSIGRRYNVSPKVIMSYNDDKFLQIDVIIKVPTEIPFTSTPSGNAGVPSNVPAGSTPGPDNGTYIEYVVKPKDNLNKIAELYGTTVEDIKRANNLNTINLSIGQLLKVPSKAEVTVTPPPVVTPPPLSKPIVTPKAVPVTTTTPKNTVPSSTSNEDFIEHTVASNETIYSIATRYNLTMDQLRAKNNLTDYSLHVGQKLLIKGQYPAKPIHTSPPVTESNPDTSSIKDPSLRYPPSRYGLNQVDEKGAAIWITDPDLDPTKMLVLHRTAPIGTVMKITNPMSNRSTFAKVVGKFTENESTKDVIIVMTKAVADAIGALDKRFFCNLTYSGQPSPAQENEQ